MPVLTATIEDFTMNSSWTGSGTPSTDRVNKTVDVSSILAGSTINSAKLSLTFVQGMWGGTLTVNGTSYSNGDEIDVKSCVSSPDTGTVMEIPFTYKCLQYGYNNDGNWHNSAGTLKDITIEIDYTLPYTSCSAPTSVSAATNVAPGATVRVSWSGASAGTNNPIGSYTVYRSTGKTTWTPLASGVTNTYLDVSAPDANEAEYYYAVAAIGTVPGYDSARSSAYATVKCSFSAPSVSNVKIDSSSSDVYKTAGSSATLSWTGTDGTNNAIQKYKIQRNGADWQETTNTSYPVAAHNTSGQSYYYTVIPIGAYSDGDGVDSRTLYTFSAPSVPSSVSVSPNNVAPGADVTLSWNGAAPGSFNAITGYRIMRSTSADGTYTQVGSDISSSAVSGSVIVSSPSTNEATYFYKVIALGVRSNSEMSGYAQLKTVWSAPTVTAVKLDGTASSQYRGAGENLTLTWIGAGGSNNPIDHYAVYRGNTKLGETTDSSYTVPANETAGGSYSYKVKAFGALSNSEYSDSITVYTYSAPTAPSFVTAANESPDAGTSTAVSWSGAESGSYNEITGYRVFRSDSQDGIYTQLGNDLAADVSSLTVTAPDTMGISFYYKVMALGQWNNSAQSSAVATVTAKSYSAPTAPTSVSVSNATPDAGADTTLSWSGATDGTNNSITGYRVFRSDSQDGIYTQLGNDLAADVSSLTVTAPSTMGSVYWYKVYALAAKSGFAISSASSAVSVTAQPYSRCTAPNMVSITKSLANPGDTVTLSWSGAEAGTNNPIAGYQVYRSTGGAFAAFQQVDANTFSVSDTVGASGSTYAYKVIALGTKPGYDSLDSIIQTLRANTKPGRIPAFSLPDACYESGTLRISWEAPSDADQNIDHYRVQRRIQEDAETWGEWELLDNVTTLYFADMPSVDRGLKFQYRVCAVDTLDLSGDYLETQEFIRNSTPLSPTIVYPVNRSDTFNLRPYLLLELSPEPDGQSQRIFLSVDGGQYMLVYSAPPSGGRIAVRVPSQVAPDSMHSIFVKVLDSKDASCPVVGCEVHVVAIAWDRAIARGAIISAPGVSFQGDTMLLPDGQFDDDTFVFADAYFDDETLVVNNSSGVSHQSEIEQLYERTNSVLSYYNMNVLSIPVSVGDLYTNAGAGKIGMFAAWGTQMQQLQTALRMVYETISVQSPEWTTITNGMIPTASVINEIRNAIENL